MAVREHEPVAVGPGRVGRVVAHDAAEQDVTERRQRHGRALVAGLRRQRRVHGQPADDVDGLLVELGGEGRHRPAGYPSAVSGKPGATRPQRNSAIDAVKPWRTLRPATGPTSPAQNMPATAPPSRPWTMRRRRGRRRRTSGAPTVAREHERAGRLVAGEQRVEVLAGGRRVAHLELHGRADREPQPATAMAPALRSAPITPRTRKSPRSKSSVLLVDDDRRTAGPWRRALGRTDRGGSTISIRRSRAGPAGQLPDDLALGAGDREGLSDRPAALRDDGRRARRGVEHQPDRAVAGDPAADDQAVAARAPGRRRHAADHGEARARRRCRALQQVADRERERVGQEHQRAGCGLGQGVVGGRRTCQPSSAGLGT